MELKKDFVPYPESLELKDLGFNEDCFGHWNYNNGKINYWYDEQIQNERTNKWFLDEEKQFPKMNKNGCTAPLYQQAFRFFREKYKLDSMVQPTYSPKYQYRMFHIESKTKVQIYGNYMDKEFNTYEEAELACLRKLIEIVKNK